jgi:hypothetical protein
MPIHFAGRTFPKFKHAVRYVMASKKFSKERASAYVAGIEKKQRPRWRGK